MILFECYLPFPPSVNGLYGGGSGQKRFPSKRYKEWLKSCPTLKPVGINQPVTVHYVFAWPDKRLRDLQNFIKAPMDFLVNQGVLADDNYAIVVQEHLSHRGVIKDKAGVDIKITAYGAPIA